MPADWKADPKHLLSPGSLGAVREALARGLVVGVHAYFAGGCSPDACGFSNFGAYEREVAASRPGDWFTLWSVPDLAREGQILYWRTTASGGNSDLEAVKSWLRKDPVREYLAIGVPHGATAPEAMFGDADSIPELEELAERCGATGELAILPLTDLAGTGEWRPRLHIVDSKRPNEKGEIPVGGPY